MVLQEKKVKTLVGIDPGLSGAIAVLGGDGSIVIRDNPVLIVKSPPVKRRGKKTKYPKSFLVDTLGTISLAKSIVPKDSTVFLEDPNHGQLRGRRGIEKLLKSTSVWETAIAAHTGIVPHLVLPAAWKKHIPGKYTNRYSDLKGRDRTAMMKQCSIDLALELFPSLEDAIAEKDGRAEALLIAYYGGQYFGNKN